MVFERRFHLHGDAFELSRFDTNAFAVQFHTAGYRRIQIDKDVEYGHTVVSVKFLDETSQTAPVLDKQLLTRIISDLLGDEIEIRIESGGAGDSGDNGAQ